ncbi:MAG TPA: class C beta-lactamase [Rhizomicrobium sp.]|jgi:beta-lactamase class C|nr:class C beta-lactamase [Rhizomicrobium sp.]
MRLRFPGTTAFALCVCVLLAVAGPAAADENSDVGTLVAGAVQPAIAQYGIPGMAVGIVVDGRSYVYNYGVMSKATGQPVTDETLFEIGSISKTFTATLASYAQATGHLSLADSASRYLPVLRGSSFDRVSLLNLGTHTSGGLPLQLPDEIQNDAQLMRYFQTWKPLCEPGACRTYSNPGIGLLGVIAAKSLHADFAALMERRLFPMLGLQHAYIDVPATETTHYAQGYTSADAPVRMAPGVLAPEAYGVRTTARDMTRFVADNMGLFALDPTLQRALVATHTGYFGLGAMTQDLIWEQYRYPAALQDLLAGNSGRMSLQANPATRLTPPLRPQDDVLINKTGSTYGFGAYVVFIPKKKLGVILLANKNYPIAARVTTAYSILTKLEAEVAKAR